MALFGRWLSRRTDGRQRKASAVGALIASQARSAWLNLGTPRWTARAYERLAEEGYVRNVIAQRSVRLVAECAAAVPLALMRGRDRLDDHPLLALMARPSPLNSGAELMERLYSYLQLAGNAYLEVVEDGAGRPRELYALRPDRITVVPGPNGWPAAYDYKVGGRTHRFPVDRVTGRSPVLHLKTFHPRDDVYGLSPLEAAAFGVDIHNAAAGWNKALLDNAARPSGALVFDPGDGQPGTLTEDQVARLKAQMAEEYGGATNAGRPLLLEGGLTWQQIAFSPADMDFINAKHVAAREIALAFGVPPMLLGIPGDNTYANYQEAHRALWRLTLLPLVDKAMAALNAWLVPRFGDGLTLAADKEAVPALAAEREALWARLGAADFLTANEKRAAVGLSPVDGGDVLTERSPPRPFDGRGPRPGAAGPRLADKAVPPGGTDHDPEALLAKVWHATDDETTRATHRAADGQVRLIDQPFDIGDTQLMAPRDPDGPPEETINCRCTMEVLPVAALTPEQREQLDLDDLVAGRGVGRPRPRGRRLRIDEQLMRERWIAARHTILKHNPKDPILQSIQSRDFVPSRQHLREIEQIARIYRLHPFSKHADIRRVERDVPRHVVVEAIRFGWWREGRTKNERVYHLPSEWSSTGRGVEVVVSVSTGRIVTVTNMGREYKPKLPRSWIENTFRR